MCSVVLLQVSINAMEILVMLCEKDTHLIKRHITDSESNEINSGNFELISSIINMHVHVTNMQLMIRTMLFCCCYV